MTLQTVTRHVTCSLLRSEAKSKLNSAFGMLSANKEKCSLTSQCSANAIDAIYGISLRCCHLLLLHSLSSSQNLGGSFHCYRSLWFKHYSFGELKQIIQSRLGDNHIFEPSALSNVVSEVSLPHISLSTYGLLISVMSIGAVKLCCMVRTQVRTTISNQNHNNKTGTQQPPHCLQQG